MYQGEQNCCSQNRTQLTLPVTSILILICTHHRHSVASYLLTYLYPLAAREYSLAARDSPP